MSVEDSNKARADLPQRDKYTGMKTMNFGLGPNVLICGGAGAVLGFILAMWAAPDPGIVAATVIVFGILSGIFGMFV